MAPPDAVVVKKRLLFISSNGPMVDIDCIHTDLATAWDRRNNIWTEQSQGKIKNIG
jgi:hypothetical protein